MRATSAAFLRLFLHLHSCFPLTNLPLPAPLVLTICSCSQFPIDCSLPWALITAAIDQSPDDMSDPSRSLEPVFALEDAVLLPFTLYDDAAEFALRVLRKQFLYDDVEAEVRGMGGEE